MSVNLAPISPTAWSTRSRRWLDAQGITESWVFSIPMSFEFRGVRERSGLLIRGEAGWGEFAPFFDYDPEESSTWLRSAIASAVATSPSPVRTHVPVNAIIPVVTPEVASRLAKETQSFTAKLKVADPRADLLADCQRVKAVAEVLRESFGDRARVRIDANGAWGADEACFAIEKLTSAAGGLEYVEQPCVSVADMAYVRARVDTLIAADESIRRADDPLRVAELEAADIAVVKVAPLGGVHAGMTLARSLGLPIVISSAVDTSVGLAAGVHLAAALPELPYACGFGTGRLLKGDVTPTLTVQMGRIAVDDADRVIRDLSLSPTGNPPMNTWINRTEEVIECLANQ
ncbi:O-succinylbenzoate synthase [Actinomycetaceae bacterium WB03_NA08]|uniref:O-succinylbenzoate synthase n=1 Tax=Scrofimicrobium canadense TaxID=2652290 RepID=A0A6N7VNQ8_9ACTO|nr:o-succinylbenzoate synthase [Scrofimicrobium canadense]MSS83327.1 O-succinylbenzoate synthase [Scrofimicrobium canadense]